MGQGFLQGQGGGGHTFTDAKVIKFFSGDSSTIAVLDVAKGNWVTITGTSVETANSVSIRSFFVTKNLIMLSGYPDIFDSTISYTIASQYTFFRSIGSNGISGFAVNFTANSESTYYIEAIPD